MGARCCKDREGRLQEHVYVEKGMGEEAGGTVIWVGGVRGLRSAAWFPGRASLQCYCVVRAKAGCAGAGGQGDVLLTTQGQVDRLEPEWNEEVRVESCPPGGGLEFSVFEGQAVATGDEHPSAAPRLLARGSLEGREILRSGFNGEVRLAGEKGAETARLAVKITVFGQCPEDRPAAFPVSIDNDPKKPIGASFDSQDGTTLQVSKVDAGLLDGSGLQVGDFIVKANAVEGSSAKLAKELKKKGPLELSARRPQEFCVAFQKKDPKKFGLEVAKKSTCLVVTKVAAGPVQAWNEANPEQEVKLGDRVVAVNGAEGKAANLLTRFNKDQRLRLTLVRPAQQPEER
mmetsp:Transcript_75881/g.245736  ORF Transcript_75881/g.245736 Transcript_75881/m.245736 type:complete len:344 (-) Transcript_75881:105-1136(-)